MTIGNDKQTVSVFWWEAVNRAKKEVVSIQRAMQLRRNIPLMKSLEIVAGAMDDWAECQERWKVAHLTEDNRQIADMYIAVKIDRKHIKEVLRTLWHTIFDDYHVDWKQTKNDVEQILELIKFCGSLPPFSAL